MILLLRTENHEDWAETLEVINLGPAQSKQSISMKILSMYGGVGSLNDIVFYRESQPLIDKNNEFDKLRSHLYELCKSFASEKTP